MGMSADRLAAIQETIDELFVGGRSRLISVGGNGLAAEMSEWHNYVPGATMTAPAEGLYVSFTESVEPEGDRSWVQFGPYWYPAGAEVAMAIPTVHVG